MNFEVPFACALTGMWNYLLRRILALPAATALEKRLLVTTWKFLGSVSIMACASFYTAQLQRNVQQATFPLALQPSLCVLQTSPPTVTTITTVATITTVTSTTTAVIITITNTTATGYSQGGPQIGICNRVQNSGCPGNIRKMYVRCPYPHKSELGEGTHGAWPLRAVLYSNSCAANPWHGHLTYL